MGSGKDASEGMGLGWNVFSSGLPGILVFPCLCLSPVPSLPRCFYLATLLLQEFFLQREPPVLQPLVLPPDLSVRQALERVLRLPAVASKRYLTNKVLLALGLLHCSLSCMLALPCTGVS